MGWMLAGLLWARVAAAGEPVSLPEGQDPALWRVPFALAGLEVAQGSDARIRIDQTASGWVLRARGPDGVVRTARVIVPDTPAEREEVAFLARGLLTTIQAQQTGAPGLPAPVKVPPPPPPPPPPISAVATAEQDPPARISARPVPAPRPEIQPEPVQPAPEPALAPDDALALSFDEPVFDPLAGARRLERPPEPAPEMPAVGRERGRERTGERERTSLRAVRASPLEVATGLAARPETQAAFAVTFGMDFAELGGSHLGWHTTFLAPRGLLRYRLPRQLQVLEWEFDLAVPVARGVQIVPDAGLSYRWYRQQGAPLVGGTGFMPVAGIKLDLELLPRLTRNFELGLDVGGKADLGRTELMDQRNRVQDLVPFELRTNFFFRWGGGGDPFAPEVTSKR